MESESDALHQRKVHASLLVASLKSIWKFLTDGMITHPGYPASIQIPHAMATVVSFRNSFTPGEYATVTAWHKAIAAYFCHGYGGSSFRDILLGQPISAMASDSVMQFYLVFGFLLINFSPGDIAYRTLTTPRHPLRLWMLFVESVDDATTIFGAFEKGARLQPNAPAAPYISALAAVLGGGIARYLERKGRGRDVKTEWSKPTGRIQTGVAYIFIYAALRRVLKVERNSAQLWFTLFDCACTLANELLPGGFENPILKIWKAMASYFKRLASPPSLGLAERAAVLSSQDKQAAIHSAALAADAHEATSSSEGALMGGFDQGADNTPLS